MINIHHSGETPDAVRLHTALRSFDSVNTEAIGERFRRQYEAPPPLATSTLAPATSTRAATTAAPVATTSQPAATTAGTIPTTSTTGAPPPTYVPTIGYVPPPAATTNGPAFFVEAATTATAQRTTASPPPTSPAQCEFEGGKPAKISKQMVLLTLFVSLQAALATEALSVHPVHREMTVVREWIWMMGNPGKMEKMPNSTTTRQLFCPRIVRVFVSLVELFKWFAM